MKAFLIHLTGDTTHLNQVQHLKNQIEARGYQVEVLADHVSGYANTRQNMLRIVKEISDCDLVIAVNESYSESLAKECVAYARERDIPIYTISNMMEWPIRISRIDRLIRNMKAIKFWSVNPNKQNFKPATV